MIKIPVPIPVAFTKIEEVETHCNFLELVIPGFLLSLEAIGDKDKHVTQGTFDRMTSEEFLKHKDELGKLKFKLDNGGTNTVWINGEKIKVSFTRK